MGLYSLTVSRPVAITMVVLGVVVFGALSFQRLPLNLMPSISYPRLTVRTEYPGSGPEEVELELSKRIEASLGTVNNLIRMTSRSRAGLSEVVIEFQWGTKMDLAMQEVREKIDRLRFPTDAKRPIILRYDPNLEPILRLGLYGKGSLFRMRRYAEDVIQPALETISGVAAVKIKGGLEKEIRVSLHEKKLQALGISIKTVSQRLKEENINLAGGRLKEGLTYYWVRTLNEFSGIKAMEKLIIAEKDGKKIRLKEIAKIEFQAKEQEVISRMDGKQSIEIAIFREAGANIVQVAKRVRERIFGSLRQKRLLASFELREKRKLNKKGKKANQQKKSAKTTTNQPTNLQKFQVWRKRMGAMSKKERKKWRKRIWKNKKGRKGKKRKGRSSFRRKGKKGKGRSWKKGKKKRFSYWRARRKEHRKKLRLHRLKKFLLYHLPNDMSLRVLQDQSVFIKASVNEVLQSALLGGIISIIVLLLFMGDVWSTLIISISIPLSVVATFGGMYMSGVSLNIMSLGGLALGIGMLVDNSIVVLENIFRIREQGVDRKTAAVQGVSEVGSAVTASTLTTIAVFFPIVFVQGVAGQLLKDLAITVVISLMSSLIVSLFFIPMLSALKLEAKESGKQKIHLLTFSFWTHLMSGLAWLKKSFSQGGPFVKLCWLVLFLPWFLYLLATTCLQLALDVVAMVWKLGVFLVLVCAGVVWKVLSLAAKALWFPIAWLFGKTLDVVQVLYPSLLKLSLRQKEVVLLACVLIAWASYSLAGGLKQEFMPKVYQGEFYLEMSFPPGTPLEQTSRRTVALESFLLKAKKVKDISSVIGVEKTEVQNAEKGEHSSTITVRLKPSKNTRKSETDVLDQVRKRFLDVPGLKFKVVYPSLFSLRTPIEILLKGTDLRELKMLSKKIVRSLQELSTLRDIRSTAIGGLPEIQLFYKRDKLFQYGLNVQDVAKVVRSKVLGDTATKFREKDKRIDVLVRVRRSQLKDAANLLNLSIRNSRGEMISLKQFARFKIDEGPSQIVRVGRQRAVLIQADLSGASLGAVTETIEERLKLITLPEGYSLSLGGQSEEMKKSLESLLYALLLSIFLVYLVMASQFESFLSPVLILGSIPLAFVGVIVVLWGLGEPISVMVLIGMIILSGIVVNNAIVLVDAVNRLVADGVEPQQALVEAGKMRLRPILMTTATTALGLLPLAMGMGEGSELRKPMAITIMAGLIISTLLTLVVIPILVRLFIFRKQKEIPLNE